MACAPYPIAVRLGNVTLPNSMVARGMDMSIGEPPQPAAFLPLWPLNSTLLYGTNGHCLSGSPNAGPWTDAGCTTFRGGAYDLLASTSRTAPDLAAYPDDSAADTVEGGSTYPQVTRVADTLRLNANISMDALPMGVALSDWGVQAYTPMMAIGLGTNSTLLNALRASGRIASRSYSYFWGRTIPGGAGRELDGSVVFGGYDRAKVAGSTAFMQPLSAAEPECPSQMVVTIADVVLNFANGSDASLFPSSSSHSAAMAACLTPGLSTLMRLPLDPYFAAMMDLTKNDVYGMGRSLGIYYWNMRYETTGYEPYDGDLTIKLQSGLSVRIPNDQLVRAHTQIDQTTGRILVNHTAPDLVIDSLQSSEATKLAQLGWQFFSAAYLHVNQDAREFTLWAANPTAAEDLVAVDPGGAVVTSFCSPDADGGSRSSNTTVIDGSGSRNAKSHAASPSVGVVAGAAAAGVVFVAVIVGVLAWWFCRRRPRQTLQSQHQQRRQQHQLEQAHKWQELTGRPPTYTQQCPDRRASVASRMELDAQPLPLELPEEEQNGKGGRTPAHWGQYELPA